VDRYDTPLDTRHTARGGTARLRRASDTDARLRMGTAAGGGAVDWRLATFQHSGLPAFILPCHLYRLFAGLRALSGAATPIAPYYITATIHTRPGRSVLHTCAILAAHASATIPNALREGLRLLSAREKHALHLGTFIRLSLLLRRMVLIAASRRAGILIA